MFLYMSCPQLGLAIVTVTQGCLLYCTAHWFVQQVGQVILNLPNSMAKCGLGLGTFFQIMCASAAVYTLWLLSALYQEYKRSGVSQHLLGLGGSDLDNAE